MARSSLCLGFDPVELCLFTAILLGGGCGRGHSTSKTWRAGDLEIVVFSILVHELGHATVAAIGASPEIVLHGFGVRR
jgi:hypothetical protein